MRRALPTFSKRQFIYDEISAFEGMNNTVHPTLLPNNVPSNLLNSYFSDGVLKKRGGTTKDGDYLTSKHTEEFTATTKKDSSATTGEWTTDGAANLFTYTTNAIDTGTTSGIMGFANQRTAAISSTESTKYIFIAYQDGGGIKGRKSANNGSTWTNLAGAAGETTIDASTTNDFSIWIDDSDHIHIAYMDNEVMYRKLTYSGGSWTVGSEETVATTGDNKVSITMTSGGTIWVSYADSPAISVKSSTDGSGIWSSATSVYTDSPLGTVSTTLILNNDQPFLIYQIIQSNTGYLYTTEYTGSAWETAKQISQGTQVDLVGQLSITRVADDNLWMIYQTASGLKAANYDGSNWGNTTVLDSSGQYTYPTITTDGTNLWAVWNNYEATNRYEIHYKLYNGTSWNSSATDVTNDNGNNIYPNLPYSVSSQTFIPIFWRTGTASPWSLKCRSVQVSGVIQSTGYDSGSGSQTYGASVVSTLGTGGTIATTYADSTDDTAYGSFVSDITTLSNQYIKFKITLTTTNLATAPSVGSVEITYGGVKIVGLHSFTRNDGAKYLVAIGATGFYVRESGTTWLNIRSNLTTNLPSTAAPFANFLIVTNGTDAVMRFNGKTTTGTATCAGGTTAVSGTTTTWNTAGENQLAAGGRIKFTGDATWYTISSVTNDTALVLTANGPNTGGAVAYEAYAVPSLSGSPNTGKYVEVHKNHVFIAGNSTNPTRLYFSDVGDAVTWPAANFINVDTNDGTIITSLASFRDTLGIFKYATGGDRRSVQGLFGAIANDFIVRPLSTAYGAVGQYSVVKTPNAVYFIDRFGIIETNFISFQRVDFPIEATTVDNWNQQYIDKAIGIYFNEFVFFAIPYGSSATNNYWLMWDIKGRGWVTHTGLDVGAATVYMSSNDPQLYFGDQTTDSVVYKWDSGTSDNGQAIDWTLETKEFPVREYFRKKKFKYLYLTFEPTGAYDVDVQYAVDGNSSYTDLSEDMTLDAGADEVVKRFVLPGVAGSTVKFRVRSNTADEAITFTKMALVSLPKTYRTI